MMITVKIILVLGIIVLSLEVLGIVALIFDTWEKVDVIYKKLLDDKKGE